MSEGAGRCIWLDGELVPWDAARVHVLSHCAARGGLVFDYMRVCHTPRGAAIFRLDDHIERFLHSCKLVGLPLEHGAGELREACRAAVRNNPGAGVVKLNAFLPSVEVDVVPVDARVSIAAAAFDPQADVLAHKSPPPPEPPRVLRLWIEKERRQRRADILHPHAKVAANYTSPMLAKWSARRRGYDDVLLVDERGFLAEGPTTNFFLVDNSGALCTPPLQSVLPGVTRRSLMELAESEGRRVIAAPLSMESLAGAAEAFLTGTGAGVMPVASLDDRPVGSACPGPVTAALAERFQRINTGADSAFAHWLCPVDDPR